MNTKHTLKFLTLSILFSVSTISAENLLINGSFESYSYGERLGSNSMDKLSKGWDVFKNGQIPGWETRNSAGAEIQKGGIISKPSDGHSHIEMDSHAFRNKDVNTNVEIFQELKLHPLEEYSLEFDYMPRPGKTDTSQVNVLWNNQLIVTLDKSFNDTKEWKHFKIKIPKGNRKGSITFKAGGKADTLGGFIDNVSLTKFSEDNDNGGGNDDDFHESPDKSCSYYAIRTSHPSGNIKSMSNKVSLIKWGAKDKKWKLVKHIGPFNASYFDVKYSSLNKPKNGYDRVLNNPHKKNINPKADQDDRIMFIANSKENFRKILNKKEQECYASNFNGGNINRNDNFWTCLTPANFQPAIDKILEKVKETNDSCENTEEPTDPDDNNEDDEETVNGLNLNFRNTVNNISIEYVGDNKHQVIPQLGYAITNNKSEGKKEFFNLSTQDERNKKINPKIKQKNNKLVFFQELNGKSYPFIKNKKLILARKPGGKNIYLGYQEASTSNCDPKFTPIFKIKVKNKSARNYTLKNSIITILKNDCDNDGVENELDEFPEDPERAFSVTLPGKNNFEFIGYEDSFPELGDGDYNDFVVAYQNTVITNAQGNVKEVTGKYYAMAHGALVDHIFNLGLTIPSKATYFTSLTNKDGEIVKELSNRIEPGRLDLQMFSSTKFAVYDNDIPSGFGNTIPGSKQIKGDLAQFKIVLDTPSSLHKIGAAPFDPYLVFYGTGYDVHLPGKSKVNNSQNPAGNDHFIDNNGYPWALKLPNNWHYPIERVLIDDAYPDFTTWRESKGQTNQNWYESNIQSHFVRNFVKNYFNK